jgi:acetyl/propionyl-CoA carboxylase alpha subunit
MVPPMYDGLIAKIMVEGPDRATAVERLRRALEETSVGGIQTTIPFHRSVVREADFRSGAVSTAWLAAHWDGAAERQRALPDALAVAGAIGLGGWSSNGRNPGDRTTPDQRQAARTEWRPTARADATDRWPR